MRLVEFLEARIAEDETGARQAIELRQAHPHDGERKIAGDVAESDWEFTPQRLLAECEAKRRIIAAHDYGWVSLAPGKPEERVCDTCATSGTWDPWPCPTLRALAAPFSSHPDFDPAWRVGGQQ